MSTIDTTTQLLTIVLAITGIFLIAKIHTMKNDMDSTTLRARAFLDASFLRDCWRLLLVSCAFFLVHAVFELSQLLGASITEGSQVAVLLEEGTELGILICILILVYKWSRLVTPVSILERKK